MAPELISRIEDRISRELPFVIYRKPRSSVTNVIFQNDAELHHVVDYSEVGFAFAPFDGNRKTILIKPDAVLKDDSTYEVNSSPSKISIDDDLSERSIYVDLVKRAISEIKAGTFDKVVLSRSFEVGRTSNGLALFCSLVSKYDNALRYLWYHPKVGTWLGATPEILLRIENNRFTTMSLAGTQKYQKGADPGWGAKEKEEQAMVTRFIASATQELVDELKISETESVRAGNVWHLRTKLSGIIKGSLSEVVKALHPTPAICGMPMDASKKFIQNNENYDRHFYTGFLGELNFKIEKDRAASTKNVENKMYRIVRSVTELFVNLRCMQLTDNTATLYVGGGITKDSDPEKEWEETLAKSQTMLEVLKSIDS